MKLRTIALATAFALSSTFALAQAGGSAAGAAGSTTPGPGTTGSDPGAVQPDKMNQNVTTGTAGSRMPSNSASTSGAPTAAGANSTGSRTQPGAVQNGTSH
jgi:hypothetical protein